MAVDAYRARTADGTPTRAPQAEGTVGVLANLDERIQNRTIILYGNRKFLPVRLRISCFRIEPLYI